MSVAIFPRLAWNGIKKNRRLYYPYIFTCIGIIMMFYIMAAFSRCRLFENVYGGSIILFMLELGKNIIGIFALIFLFYTNSFLLRRRKKELGLYNILGMDKKNISVVLAIESLIISVAGLTGGLLSGIVFFKLAELGLLHVVRMEADYVLRVSFSAVGYTVGVFCIIFFLLFLNSLWQIHRTSPLELLHSENLGERPPRANWFVAILGFMILAAAYTIAVSIKDPVAALGVFFVAVIMVIIATYMLFVAGSVTLCRILQKTKGYYYKKNHFVSVSSMLFRMKRNGAGLASICILSTMVLVMLSSAGSLYLGAEHAMRFRYPSDIGAEFYLNTPEMMENGKMDRFRKAAEKIAEQNGADRKNVLDYGYGILFGRLREGRLEIKELHSDQYTDISDYYMVHIISLESYNQMTGKEYTLAGNEALLQNFRGSYSGESIQIGDTAPLLIKGAAYGISETGTSAMSIFPSLCLVVADLDQYMEALYPMTDEEGERVLRIQWRYGFDTTAGEEVQRLVCAQLREAFNGLLIEDSTGVEKYSCEAIAEERQSFYQIYGGLFFLGIVLSILFVSATVLMIYYKQVCEGYEDQARFEIMQKVGMTKRDIRKSINSQVLTVFFAPLLFAGMHLCFAYPLVWQILEILNQRDLKYVLGVTAVVYLIFGLFYIIVYRMTSNAYYAIVSGTRE